MANQFEKKKEIGASGSKLSPEQRSRMLEKLQGVESSQAEADLRRFKGFFDLAIEKISNADISEARKVAESSDDPKLQEAARMIDFLLNYKTLSDKEEFIRRMAKRYIYRLVDASSATRGHNNDISFALEQLAGAAEAMARREFPAEWDQQEAMRKEERRQEMEEAREKIKNINVS